MERIASPTGVTISYDRRGSGPPLVLVHGGFSDHETNWALVRPHFERRFTVAAVARRGRGRLAQKLREVRAPGVVHQRGVAAVAVEQPLHVGRVRAEALGDDS